VTGLANIGALALREPTTLTVSSASVTVTQGYHVLDCTGSTADLETIVNDITHDLTVKGVTYRLRVCFIAAAGKTITLKHGVDSFDLPDDTDVDVTDEAFTWVMYDGTNWRIEKQVSAKNVGVNHITGATYTNLQNVIDLSLSAGWTSGGELTDNADGTVDIAAGTGFIRSSDSGSTAMYLFDWAATAGIDVSSGDDTYIYLDYNSGSPIVTTTTTPADVRDNEHDKFELYEVSWDGAKLHPTTHKQIALDPVALIQQRIYDINKIERAYGLILGELGTRNISLSTGRAWIKLDAVDLSVAIDTSSGDSFSRFYQDGVGGWTEQTAQAQWDNTHYDDGSGVLATLDNNKYCNQYFYFEADGDLACLFGQAEYNTLAEAEKELPPSTVPLRLEEHALLVGRVVFQKGDTTAQDVQSAFTNTFAINGGGGGVTDHGALTGLADDDHTQYLLVNGTRAMTGTLDTAGHGITMVNTVNEFSTDTTLSGVSDLAVPTEKAVRVFIDNYLAFNARVGLNVRKFDAATIVVDVGSTIVSDGTFSHVIQKTTGTTLALGTGTNWIDGSSAEAADIWVSVYCDVNGNLLLHDSLPNYPAPVPAAHVCDALVNQAGWNGMTGSGLNATSVIYDDGAGGDPTYEANIAAGMYLYVYTDLDRSQGRGKGSGAAGSVANLSIALITAVNTGTNTLTLEAGHQIAINDNDYLIVVEAGAPIYRLESLTWYRWLGALWNDGSSNLTTNRNDASSYTLNEGSDYTTTSASFVAIDSTNLHLPLVLTKGDVLVNFDGVFGQSNGNYTHLDLYVDGVAIGGDDGVMNRRYAISSYEPFPMGYHREVRLLPGTHYFDAYWKNRGVGTSKLYAGAGTANEDSHPQFSVREV
jgi:hypothetical protein